VDVVREFLLGFGAWMMTYLVHSTIALAVVAVVARALGRRHDRSAEVLWRAGMLAPVATTALQLGTFMKVTVVEAGAVVPQSSRLDAWLVEPFVIALAASALVVGAARLLSAITAHVMLRKRISNRRPLEPGRVFARRAGIRFSVASSTRVPFVLGRREVVLPARVFHEASVQELDAILAHEVAHIIRRERFWLTAASLLERVLVMQPLNRTANRRMRLLAECACDEWAAAETRDRFSIATALTKVTAWTIGAAEPSLVLAMASRESLTLQRVRRILEPAVPRGGSAVALASSLAVALLLLLYAPGFDATAAAAPLIPYTISARDDAGSFTLTMNRGRAIAATVNGARVDKARLRQSGSAVRIFDVHETTMVSLQLNERGGFSWAPRVQK
jgi:beta-lactamase regulating signal transducer with metallopeptidase domain